MKKLNFMLLLAMAVVFASCTDTETLEKDALSMIPKDASYVVAVDAGSIIKKANVKDDDGTLVFPESYKAIFGNEFDKEKIAAYIRAIDLTKKFYFFGSDDLDVCFIIPVADKKGFKSALEGDYDNDMIAADGELYKIKNGRGLYFLSDNYFIGCNINHPFKADVEEELLKSLILKGSPMSINDNADAMKILKRKSDLAVFGDCRRLFNSRELQSLTGGFGSILNDCRNMGATLNLNKKDIELAFEMFVNETGNVKKYEAVIGKPSAEGLKFIPDDIQLVLSGSLKGEELLKLDVVNQALSQVRNIPFITQDEIKEYIAGIDGPVTIGYNYVDYLIDRSSFHQIYGAVKNKKAAEICDKLQSTINNSLGGFIICNKINDEYVLNISSDMAIVFGSKDGFLYFRTVAQGVTKNLYDDKLVRGIFEEAPGALYVNLLKGSRANSMLTDFVHNLQFSGYIKGSGNTRESSLNVVIEEPEGNNVLETLLIIIANMQI